MIDIIIRRGLLINGDIVDIFIDNGVIIEINKDAQEEVVARKEINLYGKYYVSPGWIDIHTHCFEKYKLYSDNPDMIGYRTGVTTVVDAGTSGANDICEFYEKAKEYKTNVYSFLNISKIGLCRQDELSNLDNIDIIKIEESLKKYPKFILGLKARMSKSVIGESGIAPLEICKKVSKRLGVKVMVHIGSNPPDLKDILDRLDKGDIVSHIFNGKENGIIDKENNIKNEVIEAKDRGVIFDIAHGTESFSFDVAKHAMKRNILADTISTDIYVKNRINGPVYSLMKTMEKALYIGYSLEDVIDMVTINAAKAVGLNDRGKLKEGLKGDLTIFEVNNNENTLKDSLGLEVEYNKSIKPIAVLLNGEYIEI